jgi:hypothetical protein
MNNIDKINAAIVAEMAIIAHAYRLVDQTIENKPNLSLAQIDSILSELADTVDAASGRLDVLNTMKRCAKVLADA